MRFPSPAGSELTLPLADTPQAALEPYGPRMIKAWESLHQGSDGSRAASTASAELGQLQQLSPATLAPPRQPGQQQDSSPLSARNLATHDALIGWYVQVFRLCQPAGQTLHHSAGAWSPATVMHKLPVQLNVKQTAPVHACSLTSASTRRQARRP